MSSGVSGIRSMEFVPPCYNSKSKRKIYFERVIYLRRQVVSSKARVRRLHLNIVAYNILNVP